MQIVRFFIYLLCANLFSPTFNVKASDSVDVEALTFIIKISHEDLVEAYKKDFDEFYSLRQKLSSQVRKNHPREHNYIMGHIDMKFDQVFYDELHDSLMALEPPKGSLLAQAFKEILAEDDGWKLKWERDFVYRTEGGGFHNPYDRELTLTWAPFDEVLDKLVHELTHYLDRSLKMARKIIPFDSRLSWGEKEFLSRVYIKYYSEILPRVDACLAVTELVQKGLLSLSKFDKPHRYSKIIEGKLTCQKHVQWEFRFKAPPDLYWLPNSFPDKFKAIDQARSNWLKKHNLPDPFYSQLSTLNSLYERDYLKNRVNE